MIFVIEIAVVDVEKSVRYDNGDRYKCMSKMGIMIVVVFMNVNLGGYHLEQNNCART